MQSHRLKSLSMKRPTQQLDTSISEEQSAALQNTLNSIKQGSMRYNAELRKPWLDEDGAVIWPRSRVLLAQAILSQTFETIMGIIIVGNLILMVYETDQDAKCYPSFASNVAECPMRSESIAWLNTTNFVLLVVYTIECAARIYVERSSYLDNRWNQIDFLTVAIGWATTFLTFIVVNLNFLRVFRVARLLRAARVLISIREFYLLLSGFISSLRAIFFGSLMLGVCLVIWAILVVQVVHPVNSKITYDGCDRCQKGFESVSAASLTLFQQIVAGDSWGLISIPVIESEWWTGPILISIVITIALGVMNLILAVIVERATEARENDLENKLRQKDEKREKDMMELAKLCHSMDDDGSGSLSLEEMLNGCDNLESFQKLMGSMDLRREDMETIFKVLDEDNSGEVSYLEFCKILDNCSKRDPTMMQSLVKYAVMEVRKIIKEDVVEVLAEHSRLLEQLTGSRAAGCSDDASDSALSDRKISKRSNPSKHGKVRPASGSDDFDVGVEEAAFVPESKQADLQSSSNVQEIIDRLCRDIEVRDLRVQEILVTAEQQVKELLQRCSTPLAPSHGGQTGNGNGALHADGLRAELSTLPDLPDDSKDLRACGALPESLEEESEDCRHRSPSRQESPDELQAKFCLLRQSLRRRIAEDESLLKRSRHILRSLDQHLKEEGLSSAIV